MADQSSATIRLVYSHVPAVNAAIDAAVVAEVKKAALEIEAAAKARAPVRTGTLRRSIHTVLSDGDRTATVGPSVSYGIFPEFGTRHMAARPYMRPAAALVYPRFIDRLKAAIRAAT